MSHQRIIVLGRAWIGLLVEKGAVSYEPFRIEVAAPGSDAPLMLRDGEQLRKACLISINSTGFEPPMPASWTNVLALHFDDLDSPVPGREDEFALFNRGQAQAILDFLRRNSDKDLVVHCDAGISRSGAVGVFAHELFATDSDQFWSDNPRRSIDPNPLVLSLLRETAGLPKRELPPRPPEDPNVFW